MFKFSPSIHLSAAAYKHDSMEISGGVCALHLKVFNDACVGLKQTCGDNSVCSNTEEGAGRLNVAVDVKYTVLPTKNKQGKPSFVTYNYKAF